jgi:hypothetical protein
MYLTVKAVHITHTDVVKYQGRHTISWLMKRTLTICTKFCFLGYNVLKSTQCVGSFVVSFVSELIMCTPRYQYLDTMRSWDWFFIIHCDREQGCQMVYFQTKKPYLGNFWRVLQWKMLWTFGLFYSYLVYFVAIRYIIGNLVYISSRFGILYQEKSGNPPWRCGAVDIASASRTRRPGLKFRQGIR